MRTAGNIITATGLTVFFLFGCGLDDVEPYGTIAALLTLIGVIVMYIGYRFSEIEKFVRNVCERVGRKVEQCYLEVILYYKILKRWKNRQRRKHQKVKMWLDRAQRSI